MNSTAIVESSGDVETNGGDSGGQFSELTQTVLKIKGVLYRYILKSAFGKWSAAVFKPYLS